MAGTRDGGDTAAPTPGGGGTDSGVAWFLSGSRVDTGTEPMWFTDFLIDRATRKPSEHTMAPTAGTSPRWPLY